MIERLNIDGIDYELQYDIPLTQEQRIQTIDEIKRQVNTNAVKTTGCGGCGKKLNSPNDPRSANLAVTSCPPGSKVTGDTLTLSQTPSGTGPFTVTFWRQPHGTTTKTNLTPVPGYTNPRTGVATGTTAKFVYTVGTVASGDTGNVDFGATAVDESCGATYTCGSTEFCNVSLNPVTTTTTTTTTPPPATTTTTTTPPPATTTTTTTPPPATTTTTTPTTVTICTWIVSQGGWNMLTVPKIIMLVQAFGGGPSVGFPPRVPDIVGCVFYYNGSRILGNGQTGCTF